MFRYLVTVTMFSAAAVIIIMSVVSSHGDEDLLKNRVDAEVAELLTADDCVFNITTKSSDLKLGHALNRSEVCTFHISRNASIDDPSGLLLKDVHLDEKDELTIRLADSNNTIIFGPYHGVLDPFVIIVGEEEYVVNVSLVKSTKVRTFDIYYSDSCILSVPPEVEVLSAPLYKEQNKIISCRYDFVNSELENRYSFIFTDFSLAPGGHLKGTKTDGQDDETFTTTPPDIFSKGTPTSFNITLNATTSMNKFTIIKRSVYDACSGFLKITLDKVSLRSPPAVQARNDSIGFECRWLIKSDSGNGAIGLLLKDLSFSNVFDMLTVSDGPSELSTPILQASLASENVTKDQVIRTSQPYMWVLFTSRGFVSNFSGEADLDLHGGHHTGSGQITMESGSDAVFLLEVPSDEKVVLSFLTSQFKYPAFARIYDGFTTTSNLITQLNGDVWYPVVSPTSKMMVDVKNFGQSQSFTADFKGTKSDCVHMSMSLNDAFTVAGNCNSSCAWIVPPQNKTGVLKLGFQLLSLNINDTVQVFRLGDNKAPVARIVYGMNSVPPVTFNPLEGFYMNISRGECSSKADEIILIAYSNYLPGCSGSFSLVPSTELQLSSPNYPDRYPLFTSCQWDLISSGNTTQFHLSFVNMHLAPNHCIRINQTDGKTSEEVFMGDELPGDLLVGNSQIYFDSSNCNKSAPPLSLISDEGFVLNVTSSDCGGIKTDRTGTFSTSLPSSNMSSTCFWIIKVPFKETDGSSNSINFTVEEKGPKGDNSEFLVYDGASVRDALITNFTNVWSYNSSLTFVYKRYNSTPSSVFTVNYKTINCKKDEQCDNGICLHPAWRCNNVNDCGDYTDEKNCKPSPHPPDTGKSTSSVSSVTFGVVTVLFFIFGVLGAILIPKAINKYRSGRYHQFQDYPGAD